jgi:hypothetical protein
MSAPTRFPLALRTPGWCGKATIKVNGESVNPAKPGAFIDITREWRTGDEVVVKLSMPVRVRRGVYDSISMHRGPLVFSLRIEDQKRAVGQPAPGADEVEQLPKGAWNYALALDEANPAKSFELLVDVPSDRDVNPFATPPVRLIATARKVPAWTLAWNGVVALDPPAGPLRSDEPDERVTLVPFGAQDLRLTDFPVLGHSPGAINTALAFNFDANETTGWSWIGGGWWAHDGTLRTSPTGGAPGFKALVEHFTCDDLRIEADITPPPIGDAGVIFRVNKPHRSVQMPTKGTTPV